jgi:predicted nucleic acid-binding Zn ribbon protein
MNAKKPRSPCIVCGKDPYRSFYTYCSNACQRQFEYDRYIERWKRGDLSGLNNTGIVTNPIKRYLRIKFHNRCYLCSWSEVNIVTKTVPLFADHIDGNWRNNKEDNLRLVCPNCDSLSPTYGALNKGNGRRNRSISKRATEARFLINSEKNVIEIR